MSERSAWTAGPRVLSLLAVGMLLWFAPAAEAATIATGQMTADLALTGALP